MPPRMDMVAVKAVSCLCCADPPTVTDRLIGSQWPCCAVSA
jgi:hypothetical protein